MSGKFLLDTNIVIALFEGDRAAMRRLKRAEIVYLPAVAVGELFFGAHKSTRVRDNVARLEEFLAANTVLPCDTVTARAYGQLKNRLRRKGKPLPDNDIWIAALAQQYELTVVSRDHHFQEVDNLPIEVW